jgi:hypothetical protein
MDAYAILARATTIPLDEGGHGVALFTVANQTGRSVRARASVSPFEPASIEWFAIEGTTERLMPPNASEEFAVRVSAPVGEETGPRSFRLDVSSVDRPDDEWAHGPTVGFELTMRGASEPGYIETVAGALAGAVIGITIAVIAGLPAWFARGQPVFDVALVLRSLFVPMFVGDLVIGAVLGGAIGIFVALTMRTILSPTPWRTSAVYLAAGFLLVVVLELVLQIAMPAPPSSEPSFVRDLLGWVVALVGAAAAAAGARVVSRWLVLRSV